ncbi:MAG: hypothetical protein ABI925_01580 [Verrucomicrobiota bacterium]
MTIGTNEAGPTSILRRPLIWLNLLCLDAPLVAISWQWLFMRVFQVAAPIAEREGLFLTAWLIYLIDRLADSLSLSTGVPKSVRQDFCSRHKYLWVGLIAVIALLDAETIFFRVGHETFVYGIFLGAIAGIYLTINHGFSKLWRKIPIKELIVGFLFATGTLLLFVPQVLAARSTIAFAAALFAGLCALNCMAIAAWERNLDRAQSKHSIATRWPRAKIWTQFLSLLLSGACIILFFFDREFWPIASCLGLSAILLFALHFLPVRTDERAALADLVLLTPLVFAFVEKFL